jgi:hypothetical protein
LPMDRDDSERRIAELERKLAEARAARHTEHGVEQLPQFLASPEASRGWRPTGSRRPRQGRRKWDWLLGVIVLGWSLFLGVITAHTAYAYHFGTPTTAKVTSCVRNPKGGETCAGTWTVGGAASAGPIEGPFAVGTFDGQSVQVRVWGSKAYLPPTVGGFIQPAGIGIVGVVVMLPALRRWRARRRNGESPP